MFLRQPAEGNKHPVLHRGMEAAGQAAPFRQDTTLTKGETLVKTVRVIVSLVYLIAALTCLTACTNIEDFPTDLFPSIHYGLQARIGQGSTEMQMFMGWYQGQQVWYIARDTNVIKPIQQSKPFPDLLGAAQNNTVSIYVPNPYPLPKLTSALSGGAADVYFVRNFNQGPIFTTVPGNADYSGLWRVNYITWRPGVPRRVICSALDLPAPEEADIVATDIVVDDPIMAVGKLGGPWTPAPAGTYRIPQALSYDLYRKTIELPSWGAFARDPINNYLLQTEVLITDVSDPTLAAILRANLAPALNDVPDPDTQRVWIFDWTQDPAPPPGQLPVLENALAGVGQNIILNPEYSPVMQLELLRRVTLPPQVFNNPELILNCLDSGGLEVVNDDTRLNVLLVDYRRWTNIPVLDE